MPRSSKQIFLKNPYFVGRDFEQHCIRQALSADTASIIIVYGRRRIGKTELIEHSLGERNLIKLEGVEDGDREAQMYRVLYQLSIALDDKHITNMSFKTWLELFDFIADKVSQGIWTLYFEELQWLAQYENEFISDLKYVWDNRYRHNPALRIVLCGSSPSFMIKQVVQSKALYNRSTYEIHLTEFSISETQMLLGERSRREIMDAHLTIGGIPEYLKRIKGYPSVRIGICEESFLKKSYFSRDYEKIFISSFAKNIHYKEIVNLLCQNKFLTRPDIEEKLKISGGGKLTDVLNDLVLCGFIEKYTPYQVEKNSKLVRYCIADNYLRFYFKFIKPIAENIEQGDYNKAPMQALNKESYQVWLGYAFERFCRKHHTLIAKIIGFSAVSYRTGVFFNRNTNKVQRGYQVDLVFDRADHVMTICEVKYWQDKVGVDVIEEFETKLRLIDNSKSKTIQKVLIVANGITDALKHRAYFDYVISLEDIFEEASRTVT